MFPLESTTIPEGGPETLGSPTKLENERVCEAAEISLTNQRWRFVPGWFASIELASVSPAELTAAK